MRVIIASSTRILNDAHVTEHSGALIASVSTHSVSTRIAVSHAATLPSGPAPPPDPPTPPVHGDDAALLEGPQDRDRRTSREPASFSDGGVIAACSR